MCTINQGASVFFFFFSKSLIYAYFVFISVGPPFWVEYRTHGWTGRYQVFIGKFDGGKEKFLEKLWEFTVDDKVGQP